MRLLSASRTDAVAGIAIIVLCPLIAAFAMSGGRMRLLLVAGVVALAVGSYIGLRHPLWLCWGLAISLGALPFGYFPGVHVPLVLLFAAGTVVAAVIHPSQRSGLHSLEVVLVVFVLISGVSVIANLKSLADILDYVKWVFATLLVLALLRLSRADLIRFGRVFVYAATANALFGMLLVATTGHHLIKLLSPFGYGGIDQARFVYSEEGVQESVRLGGSWVDPNAAGIGLMIALAVAIVVLDGWQRLVIPTILAVGLALTLSRSTIVSAAVGVGLVLLFHGMDRRRRLLTIGGITAAAAAAMLVPDIRNRLLSSFNEDAFATTSRWDPIKNFPHTMSGHWLFGLGWGRPEYSDGSLAFKLGHVSNAPLLTVYRGGIFTGLAFVAVLVVGCIIGWRALRSDSLPHALFGGIFIGFSFVGLQLDHPVVAVPPITTTFSILLAFVVFIDLERTAGRRRIPLEAPGSEPAPAAPDGALSAPA